ncbi:MAG: hypothetical protein O7G85_05050 [Planctomycetota bacterium]|nr:hypothetical protein [Planctomycetota bacterium]
MSLMLYALLLCVALVPCVIYAVVVLMEVPGMADERLGVLEELPDDVGEWKLDTESEQARAAIDDGLICETRLWITTSIMQFNREKIYRQVRYLDPRTLDVVRSEKDIRIKRKRVKKR